MIDISTIAGFIFAFGCVIVGTILSGGVLSSYWNLASIIIVLGGTLGATIMSYPLKDTQIVLSKAAIKAFKTKKIDYLSTIDKIIDLALIARKDGLLSLEKKLPDLNDSFLQKGLQLAVDGLDSNKIIEIMENEIAELESRHSKAINWLTTASGYSPTFGMMGTIIGLIIALGNMSSPETLGKAVAVAFITTFYGVLFANLIYVPISKKLSIRSEEEVKEKQLMLKGILGIQNGSNPRIIKEELLVFIKTKKSEDKNVKNLKSEELIKNKLEKEKAN
jgi:chemotaxis protein MotA